MNMCSSCLDSWLEDNCTGFESALTHYPLCNGPFLCSGFQISVVVQMVLRKSLHYCNKMNRFAEMFRVPGEISIYGSFS